MSMSDNDLRVEFTHRLKSVHWWILSRFFDMLNEDSLVTVTTKPRAIHRFLTRETDVPFCGDQPMPPQAFRLSNGFHASYLREKARQITPNPSGRHRFGQGVPFNSEKNIFRTPPIDILEQANVDNVVSD